MCQISVSKEWSIDDLVNVCLFYFNVLLILSTTHLIEILKIASVVRFVIKMNYKQLQQ